MRFLIVLICLFGLLLGQAGKSAYASEVARLVSLAQSGDVAEAAALRDALAARGELSNDTGAFIDAMLLQRSGDLEGAEQRLRALLDAAPEARRVRFELVRVLFSRGRYTAARFHLDLLKESEPDPRLLGVYQALDNEITRRRPWDASLSLAVAPKTNANGGASGETIIVNGLPFRINDDSRAAADTGVDFDAVLARRFVLTDRHTIVARGFARGTAYRNKRYGSQEAGLGSFLRTRFGPRTFLDAGIDTSALIYEHRPNAWLFSPHLSGQIGLSNGWSFSGGVQASHVDFDAPGRDDGWRGSVSAGLRYTPDASRSLSARLAARMDRSGADHEQYDGVDLSVSMFRTLPAEIDATLSGSIGKRDYRGPFPLLGFEREDRFASAALSLTKKDWSVQGFAPTLTLSWQGQDSNVAFYQSGGLGASLGLSRSF